MAVLRYIYRLQKIMQILRGILVLDFLTSFEGYCWNMGQIANAKQTNAKHRLIWRDHLQ
jgi:hypothetical protein